MNVPVLLIPAGSKDFFSRDKDADVRSLQNVLPFSFVEHFPDNGHDIHTENPIGLAEVLQRFILENCIASTPLSTSGCISTINELHGLEEQESTIDTI